MNTEEILELIDKMIAEWDSVKTWASVCKRDALKELKAEIERRIKVKNEEIDKWMDLHCPWYLGRWKVSNDCDKTCPITAENRDTSMCPEEYYNDDFD